MPIADIDFEDYFPPERVQEYWEIFRKYDRNGDGHICVDELSELLSSCGCSTKRAQIDALLAEVDHDASGELEFEEFLVLVIKAQNARPRADLINYRDWCDEPILRKITETFRKYDCSGDGAIDKAELTRVFKESLGLKLQPSQVEEACQEVDKDQSGQIEFDEFASMWVVLSRKRKPINPREYLTAQELGANLEMFRAFDKSGDGKIDVDELDALFRRVGVVLRPDRLKAAVRQFDSDGSGEIDFEEFSAMLIQLRGLKRRRKLTTTTCSVPQLQQEGFSVREMKRVGFDARALRQAGLLAKDLLQENLFSPLDLRRAGFDAVELRRGGAASSALRYCGFSTAELRNAGFSPQVCSAANRNLNRALENQDFSLLAETHPLFPMGDPSKPPRWAPSLPLHMTPRIRHNTDSYQLKESKGRRGVKLAALSCVAAGRFKKRLSGAAAAPKGGVGVSGTPKSGFVPGSQASPNHGTPEQWKRHSVRGEADPGRSGGAGGRFLAPLAAAVKASLSVSGDPGPIQDRNENVSLRNSVSRPELPPSFGQSCSPKKGGAGVKKVAL